MAVLSNTSSRSILRTLTVCSLNALCLHITRQWRNLGDFKRAITDTIQALGTGIRKARDGHVIARILSRQQLKDESLRRKVQAVEKALARFARGSMN